MLNNLTLPLILFVCLTLSGCMNPFPFGPGRVHVNLEQAKVTKISETYLWGEDVIKYRRPGFRKIVEFVISSDTDFQDYFQGRQLQVRCRVEGASTGNKYSDLGTPFYDDFDLSHYKRGQNGTTKLTPKDGKFTYTLYSFMDLIANEEGAPIGSPASRLNFEQAGFEKLACFVTGVKKSSILIPRSNDVSMSFEEFGKTLSAYKESEQ